MDCKLIPFRSDNETEHVKGEFDKYHQENDIQRQLTVLGSLQSNC